VNWGRRGVPGKEGQSEKTVAHKCVHELLVLRQQERGRKISRQVGAGEKWSGEKKQFFVRGRGIVQGSEKGERRIRAKMWVCCVRSNILTDILKNFPTQKVMQKG